jgi:hypothetical protein
MPNLKKVSIAQIPPIKVTETAIEGSNLRPARLFIALLIAFKSDMKLDF